MLEQDFGEIRPGFNSEQDSVVFTHRQEGTRKDVANQQEENAKVEQILANLAQIGSQEKSKTKNPIKQLAKRKARKPNNAGFEPFLKEPEGSQRFINLYDGIFAQNLELDRIRAEEFIQDAALEGIIVLTSVPKLRGRSIDINPDGSVTAKKSLSFGETPKVEEEEKPVRVISIPEGWKIEICDQAIYEELQEKYSGRELQKKFVTTFNQFLRVGIGEIIWREKWKGEKDSFFRTKVFTSVIFPTVISSITLIGGLTLYDISAVGAVMISYGMSNLYDRIRDNRLGGLRDFIKIPKLSRNLSSVYEYFMPKVEIDRIARGLFYLNFKGRNLVRLGGK